MDKLERAITVLHEVDKESGRRSSGSYIHPFSRFLITILFILFTVSFGKYQFLGLLSMSLFFVVTSIWENISILKGIKRCRIIILLLLFVGIANPFFDRTIVAHLGSFAVTAGMISMITLFVKGLLTVCAAYFLMIQIGMEGICVALTKLPIPKTAVTVLLLIYRYLIVFLKEIQRMSQAYHLRSPKSKGIHISAWGSFVGLLLLRSIDRAGEVYDSMKLRGYDGTFRYESERIKEQVSMTYSILYVIGWGAIFILLRTFPVFQIVGSLFLG